MKNQRQKATQSQKDSRKAVEAVAEIVCDPDNAEALDLYFALGTRKEIDDLKAKLAEKERQFMRDCMTHEMEHGKPIQWKDDYKPIAWQSQRRQDDTVEEAEIRAKLESFIGKPKYETPGMSDYWDSVNRDGTAHKLGFTIINLGDKAPMTIGYLPDADFPKS